MTSDSGDCTEVDSSLACVDECSADTIYRRSELATNRHGIRRQVSGSGRTTANRSKGAGFLAGDTMIRRAGRNANEFAFYEAKVVPESPDGQPVLTFTTISVGIGPRAKRPAH